MKQTEFTLLRTSLLNDVINNISLELQQKKIDRTFIANEIKILKDMTTETNEKKELFRHVDKLPANLYGTSAETILTAYCYVLGAEFNYDYDKLIKRNRTPEYVRRREIFAYITYNALKGIVSLQSIGEYLGGCDHSTIIHNIRNAQKWIEQNDFDFINQVQIAIDVVKKAGLKVGEVENKTKFLISNNKRNKIIQL
jgi:hypothetical protein